MYRVSKQLWFCAAHQVRLSETQCEAMHGHNYRVLIHAEAKELDRTSYVLDFACREMEDADLLRSIPADKRVAVGVIDVRTLEIEPPEQVAARIRAVLRHIDAERVTVTTDCGMKQLPRPCAAQKLRSLVEGARLVRRELGAA